MQDKILMESSRRGYYFLGVFPLAYVIFSTAMIVNKTLALQTQILKLDFFVIFQLVFVAALTAAVAFFCLRAGILQVGERAAYFKNIFTGASQTVAYEKIKSVDAFIILFGYKIAYQLTLKNAPRWRGKLIFFSFRHRPGGGNPVVDPIFEALNKKIKR